MAINHMPCLIAPTKPPCVDDFLGIPKYVHSRKRQLLGTAFGFPGGFAWALKASREAEVSWGFPGAGRRVGFGAIFDGRNWDTCGD
jgi:poly(A) polymerase Pap1